MLFFILIYSFINKQSSLEKLSTLGEPNYFKTYRLTDGSIVNVKIQDTAGQERFKSLGDKYYIKADCCLLVYDITKKKTFDEIKDFYNPIIKQLCKPNLVVILLGNKTDLENEREVQPEEGAAFAQENDYQFLETSCLKNENVASAFETLIENTNIEAQKNKSQGNQNIQLQAKDLKKKSKCCLFNLFL